MKVKEYTEAANIFTEIIDKIDPQYSEAIFYRAISYLDQGNLQQSISELWRIVEFKNSHDTAEKEMSMQAYVLLSIAHKRIG